MTDDPPIESYDNGAADLRKRSRRNVVPERLPPNAIEAEQCVLSCILLAPYASIYECITVFRDGPVVFYDLRHRVIYETLIAMADAREDIDVITVQQRLKDKQQLEAVGGLAYIAALPDMSPSASNLPTYISIVADKHRLRKLIRSCTDIVTEAYESQEDTDALIDRSESDFLAATQRQSADIAIQCKDAVYRALNRFESYTTNQGALAGLSTGFPDLDKMTSGLRGGQLIVIAGRPGTGKTSLAMNIVESVALDQKVPVGVFSLEMTEDELIERMICSRGRVNMRNVREGFFTERDYPRITVAAGRLASAPLYIDDSVGLSIMEVRARARRMAQMYEIKLFVIDFMQLVHSTSKKAHNRQQELGDVSRGCKALAKDLGVPVIGLAQMNRDVEKDKNRKPRLSDLRESGDFEQDADLVGLLYKPRRDDEGENDYEQEAEPVNLLIAKQRSGPVGDVYLTFLKSFTRFESAARISADIPDDRQTELPTE